MDNVAEGRVTLERERERERERFWRATGIQDMLSPRQARTVSTKFGNVRELREQVFFFFFFGARALGVDQNMVAQAVPLKMHGIT